MSNLICNYVDFVYPKGYNELLELNLVDFEYWYFFPENQIEQRFLGLKKRYPDRKLIPFARRDDNDDIACFEIGQGDNVYIIHDYASSGYEQKEIYPNIWIWLKIAINELVSKKVQ